MALVTATDMFPQLMALDTAQLVARRAELLGDRTSYHPLTDAELEELSAVLALLRRKQSGPPREKPVKPAKGTAFNLSDLSLE